MTFLSKYGVARHIYIPMVKRGVVDHAVSADWTPAAGDVKISKDGGAAANVTNLPVAIAMGNSTIWDFSLTATEMQAAQVVVTIADSATKAVEDSAFIIETHGNASGQFQIDLSDGVRAGLTALPNAAASAVGGLPVAVDTSGRVDVLKINGTSQTARDLGASVLIAPGTGTGQLDVTNGVIKANLAQILGTAFTETAGQIAAGFKQFFNIASPTSTMNTITAVTTATNLTNAPTAGDLTATMKASVTTAATAATPAAASVTGAVGSVAAGGITAASIAASALNGKGDWNIGKTGYALSSAGVLAIWDALTSALTTVGSIGKLLVTNIDAAISSRSSYAGGDTSGTTTLLSRLTSTRAGNLDNLDATVSSRLASASYTAPDNASITAIKAKTDNLPASPAATSDIPTASIAAIKAKTDSLTFTKAGEVDANIQSVNDVTVNGIGSAASPWGP